MKRIRSVFWILILAGISCFNVFSQGNPNTLKPENLDITVKPSKDAFYLGEIVTVGIEFNNKGVKDLYIPADVIDDVAIYISDKKDSGYKKYVGTKNGFVIDGVFPDVKIGAHESIDRPRNIFWNLRRENSAGKNGNKKLFTDYAFPAAGEYFVRAELNISSSDGDTKIESGIVKISIDEPAGDDLAAWNKIKNRGDLGYFIQNGELWAPANKTSEREKLKEVEELRDDYPGTIISSQIKQSLEKLRKMEQAGKSLVEKKNNLQ